MASLTYMIYKENTKEEEENEPRFHRGNTSSSSRANVFISSFQEKWKHGDQYNVAKHGSIGTMAPAPPRLRELIKESGFLDELGPRREISLMPEEAEVPLYAGYRRSQDDETTIDRALQGVMEEVLTIDEQKPLPCTCPKDNCIYHSHHVCRMCPHTRSISSQPSRKFPFELIPQYSTSTTDPWYFDLSEISSEQLKFQMCQPPPTEDSQPSRASTDFGKSNTGRLSSSYKWTDASVFENRFGEPSPSTCDSIIPAQIPQVNSAQSLETMVSALTFPQEITPAKLCIDPRAPQCHIELEQQRQGHIDQTRRTRNHSPAPNPPSPPARHNTASTGARPKASLRKVSIDSGRLSMDPFETTPNFRFPSHDCWGIGGSRSKDDAESGYTRRETSISPSQLQGPISSGSQGRYRSFHIPDVPEGDFNPKLFPAKDHISRTDESIDDTLARGSGIIAAETMPVRVKHAPRKIVRILNREKEVCTGFYSGPINRSNQLHGNGIFWFSTGDLYLGQFCENNLHGFGALSIRQENEPNRILKGFFVRNKYIGKIFDPDEFQ